MMLLLLSATELTAFCYFLWLDFIFSAINIRSATIRNYVGTHPQPDRVLNPEKHLLLSATKLTAFCYFLWVKKFKKKLTDGGDIR